MSIDTLRVINTRLKPVERKIRQMLRFGKVTRVEGSFLRVSFSELEEIADVPVLTINGLQMSPKSGDFVLIFSPEGNLSNSFALAVVESATQSKEHEITLASSSQTLGQVLQSLKDAIEEVRGAGFFATPSGPVTVQNPKPKEINIQGFA